MGFTSIIVSKQSFELLDPTRVGFVYCLLILTLYLSAYHTKKPYKLFTATGFPPFSSAEFVRVSFILCRFVCILWDVLQPPPKSRRLINPLSLVRAAMGHGWLAPDLCRSGRRFKCEERTPPPSGHVAKENRILRSYTRAHTRTIAASLRFCTLFFETESDKNLFSRK